jgi:transcription initiation factor TFIIIB Brf1 subunit/transcription initiation factor TFIIB
MSNSCKHVNQVTDYHEGTTICLDCSFVIEDQLFIENVCKPDETFDENSDLKEVLTRLNCSYSVLQDTNIHKVSDLYCKINERNSISLKEFCAASGLSSKEIVKKNKESVNMQDMDCMLEKYCKLHMLTYKNYTLIKEQINKKPHSGHPPLTIIGYHIYNFIKQELKKKITVKEICNTLGISSISIQRYKKYELSLRT